MEEEGLRDCGRRSWDASRGEWVGFGDWRPCDTRRKDHVQCLGTVEAPPGGGEKLKMLVRPAHTLTRATLDGPHGGGGAGGEEDRSGTHSSSCEQPFSMARNVAVAPHAEAARHRQVRASRLRLQLAEHRLAHRPRTARSPPFRSPVGPDGTLAALLFPGRSQLALRASPNHFSQRNAPSDSIKFERICSSSEIKPVNPKRECAEYSLEGTDEASILGLLM